MTTKAEITSHYILETVAPVFNKYGYEGTSISDLTNATGLTKGAIYGNFKNKEELALAAFDLNVKKIYFTLRDKLQGIESPKLQFQALTDYYREYFDFTSHLGGCPILNVGVDANFQNPKLLQRVRQVINRFKNNISKMISRGIELKEFRSDINPDKYGGRIFTFIEGGVFMAVTMQDKGYLSDIMDHIDQMIETEIAIK